MAKAQKDLVAPPGVEESGKPQDTETALAPVNVSEREPDDVVYAPRVNVSSSGRISAVLEGVAAEFKRLHPGQDCRWVFHSARKPELSNVISRMTEGYSMIEPKQFKGYPIEPYVDEKGMIRVGDTVLMQIPTGQRKVNAEARQRMADQQLRSVKEGAANSMEQVREGDHKLHVRGGLKFEEREHDLNYVQPDSKE